MADSHAPLPLSEHEVSALAGGLSHDLGAAIRHIESFSALLLDQKGDQLDDQARQWVDFIRKGGARMSRINRAVIAYLRLERGPDPLEPCDLGEMVSVVWDQVGGVGSQNTELTQGQLPVVLADRELLTQAVAAIVDNARRHARRQGGDGVRLRVRTEESGDVVRVLFEDNGPGIPSTRTAAALSPLESMAAGEQAAGMGLAATRRIADLHGWKLSLRAVEPSGLQVAIEIGREHIVD